MFSVSSSWVPDFSTIRLWDLFHPVGYALLFLYCFYMTYILVMGIYRAQLQNKLNHFTFTLCLPWVALGYALDVFANIFIVPFLFLELPREWLVTTRLTRHIKTPESEQSWRYKMSKWICNNMLDIFDPTGCHCD